MAIKVSGTEVISSSRELVNITSIDATTQSTFESSLDLNNRAVGTVTGNATLDLSTGTIFEHTPTADTTFLFSNPPSSGTGYSFDLKVTGAEVGFPYDLANAVFAGDPFGRFGVAAEQSSPTGIAFKPDGTKMYVCGSSGNEVNEYNLSTAWEIFSASYVQTFSTQSEESTTQDVRFKPDGTKMYIIGSSGKNITEYNLSTAWDISTASYSQDSNITLGTGPTGMFFKPDGTKVYITGTNAGINEYNLSTAWDVSTMSVVASFNPSSQDTNMQSIFFKDDGTKMYAVGSNNDNVYEYSLSTAWSVNTASYSSIAFNVSSEESNPFGLFFKSDGTQFYIVGSIKSAVFSYSLSTAWDVSSASWDAPTSGYFFVSSQETSPEDVLFKPDGTKMYILGQQGDSIYEYNLSTAWEVSSAVYLQAFSVNAQETSAKGAFFKPDGTKMYVCGSSGDAVHEYDLSTAWDVSSASFLQSFSVSPQTQNPEGVFFKTDGTKMYTIDGVTDSVREYNLSTAWDISTASFNQSFSVNAQETFPTGVFFTSDGTKFYIVGASGNSVHEYDLSTAWDVSSATYSNNVLNLTSWETWLGGLFFKPDGTKLYIVGRDSDAVVAFTTGKETPGPATLTYPASVSWLDASAPADPADGEVLSLQFFTTDGGTTYYGSKNGNLFTDADHTKLDGIEAGADVTDAANVEPLVDTHLNTSSATAGQALSWNGSDYEWAIPLTRTVAASATSGTLAPDSATTDIWNAFALSGATTIDTPSGTPTDGQRLILRLRDDGTSQTLAWTTSSGGYRVVGVELPLTTTVSKLTYVGCIYNSTDSFWDVVAVGTEA